MTDQNDLNVNLRDPEYRHAYAHPDLTFDAILAMQIRFTRKKRGWTRRELAKRVGVDVSTIIKVENGTISISYKTLVRLAEVLDVVAEMRLRSYRDFAMDPAPTVEQLEVESYAESIKRQPKLRPGEGMQWATSKRRALPEKTDLLVRIGPGTPVELGRVVGGVFYRHDAITRRYYPTTILNGSVEFLIVPK